MARISISEHARRALQSGRQAEPQHDTTQRRHLPWRAVALILPGGSGAQGTDCEARPSVYFGGKFRIVDFALSNCVNSGIRRIGVITQHRTHSLQRHLQRGWVAMKSGAEDLIDLMPSAQHDKTGHAHQGKAGAVLQQQAMVDAANAQYVLVIDGDHVYKMNYALMLADHIAKGRECTVACLDMPHAEACAFGVMVVNEQWQITGIDEPSDTPLSMPHHTGRKLASMGVYIFNASYLFAELARDSDNPASSHDFAKDIIPLAVRSGNAAAHPFSRSCVGNAPGVAPYWRDIGSIDAYWEANIDLTAPQPLFNLYDTHWPIWTHQAQLAPTKFLHNEPDRRGMAVESLVSGGCIISGSVLRSVLFPEVRVHSYAVVDGSVLLPGVQVGRHARLSRVVVERDCAIPDGLVIGEDATADAKRFFRTDKGITLVTAAMLERWATRPGATT